MLGKNKFNPRKRKVSEQDNPFGYRRIKILLNTYQKMVIKITFLFLRIHFPL